MSISSLSELLHPEINVLWSVAYEPVDWKDGLKNPVLFDIDTCSRG